MDKKSYGYLGPPGTFSEMSALKYSRACDKIIPYQTIREVVEKVSEGEIQRGIIPLENSQEGSVNLSLDLLLNKSDLKIIGEVIIPIEHYLLVPSDLEMEDIREIYSHPQAIAQTRDFIYKHLPEVDLNYTDSTASAAELILDSDHKAMIGSKRINELYDLKVLAQNIEGELENQTRFIIIAPENESDSYNNEISEEIFKTSIVCAPDVNRPGVLYEILGEFANRKIDLTRIESRPTKKRLGQYLFYIDLAGNCNQEQVAQALKKVEKMCRLFKVLGSYPRDDQNDEKSKMRGGKDVTEKRRVTK